MRNDNVTRGQPNRRNLDHRFALTWARLGWEDARNGRPFRPEYETANPLEQGNYEIGRIQAVNVRAAGINPPAWPAKTALPKWAFPLWQEAADTVGNARCDIRA